MFAEQLRREVSARFPGSHLQIVGGFLFLRFICPAVVSPETHGLTKPGTCTALHIYDLHAKCLNTQSSTQLARTLRPLTTHTYTHTATPYLTYLQQRA